MTIEENSDQAQAKNKIGPNTDLDVTIRNLKIDQRNVLIQVRDIHRIQSVSYFDSNVDDLFVLKRPRMKTENLSENSFFQIQLHSSTQPPIAQEMARKTLPFIFISPFSLKAIPPTLPQPLFAELDHL